MSLSDKLVRNVHILAVCLAAGFSFGCLSGALSTGTCLAATLPRPEKPDPECEPRHERRVIHFSKTKSAGIVSAYNPAPDRYKIPVLKQRAQGDVVIPANCYCRLEVGKEFFQDPDLLKGIDPYALDTLVIRMSSLDDAEEGLCDNALAHIGHLKGLQSIYLDRSDASDKGLSYLKTLTGLHSIEATSCLSHGKALKDLVTLKELRTLRIGGMPIEQEYLKYLASLPKLTQLSLTRSGLDAEGLKYVSHCSKLKVLQIGQNKKIGDDDMKYIAPLKHLYLLQLSDTPVTIKGLAILKDRINPLVFDTPEASYSAAELAQLRKIFPLAKLQMSAHNSKVFSKDDAAKIFSPISRDKGL